MTSYAPPVPTIDINPANILAGFQTFGASGGPTTIITVPAGRTWVGTISASASTDEVAAGAIAGQALMVVTTAGAGVVPAAGTILACQALAGANAATGLSGTQGANTTGPIPFTIVAPAGNAVTVQATFTGTGTVSRGDVTCAGYLQ